MDFIENQYYHLYNRTNNEEALFRSRDNYIFFLKKYRYYFDDLFDTISYCLMPTHFHFLVKVKPEIKMESTWQMESISKKSYSRNISDRIGIWLSSYTKAFNRMYERHGSLFQNHTKAKLIEKEEYYISLIFYIHQNPIRTGISDKPEKWEFSSYQEYIDLRQGNLPKMDLIKSKFTINDIKEITELVNHPIIKKWNDRR
jgi:putative transposase